MIFYKTSEVSTFSSIFGPYIFPIFQRSEGNSFPPDFQEIHPKPLIALPVLKNEKLFVGKKNEPVSKGKASINDIENINFDHLNYFVFTTEYFLGRDTSLLIIQIKIRLRARNHFALKKNILKFQKYP